MLMTCNIIFLLCFLILWTGCSREPVETSDTELQSIQLGEQKRGYVVMWRLVVTPLSATGGEANVQYRWEDAHTLCMTLPEYVPIDALRVLCRYEGRKVEIPISVIPRKNESVPRVQYLFFRDVVMLQVDFGDTQNIPEQVEVISIGRL